ncbi:MAG: glutamate racemase [Flavobacteriaceae bacterium]
MNSFQDHPIGFFDSGVGGTSIWHEVHQLLPNENTIYLADSKNAPYGQKTEEEIIEFSYKNTEFLLNRNCKLIVVACNTATTNAISLLREKYDVPFIGIEPAIKPAGLITKTNTIGILATKGTLNSKLFETTSEKISEEISIIERIGEGLVDLIESGNIESPEITILLKQYLSPMIQENIDALVLGCTHYPYLIPQIRVIVGDTVQIIDSGLAVARQTKHVLGKFDLAQSSNKRKITHFFYSNTDANVLKSLVRLKNAIILEENF